MEDEEKINKEIQSFLAKTTRPAAESQSKVENTQKNTSAGELVDMLSRLQRTYSKIQEALEAKDEEGVKSEILKSDVKMSLVCESLVRVLRETYIERNEFAEAIERLEAKEASLAKEKKHLEERVIRLENEVKYAAQASGEMERFIKDQKQSLEAIKGKFDSQRKALENMKLVNEEIDASRKLLIEKCEVSSMEIETLKGHIEDRARIIEDLKEKLKAQEKLGESLQAANKSLLAKTEALSKKLEIKEKSLDVVNSELARLLKQKGVKDADAHLSAIENGNCADSESVHNDDTVLKYQKIKEKYRRTRRKLLRKVRSYEEQRKLNEQDILEIDKLQRSVKNLKSERALESENNKQLVECLIKKIESLIEQNHKTQDELYRMKMRELDKERLPNLSFKSCTGGEMADSACVGNTEKREPVAGLGIDMHRNTNAGVAATAERMVDNAHGTVQGGRDREYMQGLDARGDEKMYSHARDRDTVIKDLPQGPLYADVRGSVQGIFDLKKSEEEANAGERHRYYSFADDEVWKTMEEHNKEEVSADEYKSLYDAYNDFVSVPRNTYAGVHLSGDREQPPEYRTGLEEQKSTRAEDRLNVGEEVGIEKKGEDPPRTETMAEKHAAEHNQFTFLDETGGWDRDQYGEQQSIRESAHREDENINIDRLSETSAMTVKTASTTQTLRDMLKRTEKLKGKFSDLENELLNIKKINTGPEVSAKNNLGYYYPDVNDISNDPDFL